MMMYNKIENINNVGGLLKVWLRSLPNPLLSTTQPIIEAMKSSDDASKLEQLKALISALPRLNYLILFQIVRLLSVGSFFLPPPLSLPPSSFLLFPLPFLFPFPFLFLFPSYAFFPPLSPSPSLLPICTFFTPPFFLGPPFLLPLPLPLAPFFSSNISLDFLRDGK